MPPKEVLLVKLLHDILNSEHALCFKWPNAVDSVDFLPLLPTSNFIAFSSCVFILFNSLYVRGYMNISAAQKLPHLHFCMKNNLT